MQVERQDVFSVPLFRNTYDNADFLKSQVKPLLYKIEQDDKEPAYYPKNGYTSYKTNSNILDLPELSDLKTWIGITAQSIHKNMGLAGNVYFTGSWFTINRQYSYHERHNHMPDTWSGVYYLQAEQGDSGLTVVNPNKDANWPNCPVEKLNDFTSPSIITKVETGTLIMFPSYIPHKVEQQQDDRERISIAFNLKATTNTQE